MNHRGHKIRFKDREESPQSSPPVCYVEIHTSYRLHSEFTNQQVTTCEKSASNLWWLRASVARGRPCGGRAEEEARTAHSSPTKGLHCLAAPQKLSGPCS